MAFQKIIIIGSPGAGKSTFERKLRDITGLPLHKEEIFEKIYGEQIEELTNRSLRIRVYVSSVS